MQKRAGFTLIDLLISMAIFALVSVSFIVIFVAIVNVQTRQSSQAEVNQQSQFFLQQLQYYIGNANLVDLPLDTATTTLKLRMASSSMDPLIITISGGVAYVQPGNATAQAITSNRVTISSTSFTRHYNLGSSTALGTESVSFSYVVSENASNTKQQYTEKFQSSAEVLGSVPKIALLQQAKASDASGNSPSVPSLTAVYGSTNETTSLLVALTANTTSSASVAITDSAGNTWSKVASLVYPAYNEEINVFDALNAKSSSNTVTASFGAGAGYASLFIYEYRGAATSSSFDASSSQLQAATKTPSSGSVTPSSQVELLFGATYNGSTSTVETPAPESGFTLETSSSVANVFVEDATQYITGAVAATWQYTNTTPSSSVVITTFK